MVRRNLFPERRNLFPERRKLFSEPSIVRRRLFSEPVNSPLEQETAPSNKKVVCRDCGYSFDTAATTNLICPKCGGTRFNIESNIDNHPTDTNEESKTFSRRSLFEEDFQKEFSETSNPLELKLKEYSGDVLSSNLFEKEFGNYTTASELQERGFAEVKENGDVKINDDAFVQSRLFSKIVISITKTLELDPDICKCAGQVNKEPIIDSLEDSGRLTPKCIMILRKSHGIPVGDRNDEWAKDSGILGDVPIEFGGQTKSIPDFRTTLESRYPDAPEDLMDLLKRKGVIDITGNNVHIIK